MEECKISAVILVTSWLQSKSVFFFIITAHHIPAVCPFFSVPAAQPDVLCEDVRPSLLSGGYQSRMHADLDGCHRHGNRWAQPLLTSCIRDCKKKLEWSYWADAGRESFPRLRGWFCTWTRESVDEVCVRCRGAEVRDADQMCSNRCAWTQRRKLLLDAWVAAEVHCRTSCKPQHQPAHWKSVTGRVSLFEPDLPLLVRVQHYRTGVNYTTTHYKRGVDTIIATPIQYDAIQLQQPSNKYIRY